MANAPFLPVRENTVASKLDLKIDEFPGGPHSGELGDVQQPPILVLSRYSALIETVRKAAPRGAPVVPAPEVEQATLKIRTLKPGVLVIDTASTADLAALVAQLTEHFPALVIVAAGQRDDSAALMQLTAAGQIFRFLLVPLSHGQTRLTLDAAIAEHKRHMAIEAETAESRAPAAKKRDVTGYIAFVLGLAVSVAGIWWFLSRTPKASQAPEAPVAAVTVPTALPPSTVASEPDPLQTELARAQAAFVRGEYVEPVGRSALDYYRAALRIDPESSAAQEGIRRITSTMLERAESALTAQKLEEAAAALAIAREIDPQHPRLAPLEAQMAAERAKVAQAQDINGKITALLARAQALKNQGRLVSPKGGSALDTLLEARRLDPANTAVAQGSRDLAQALAQEANRLVKVGNLDEAQSFVTSARVLGSDGTALAAVESALSEARSNAANRAPRPASLAKASPPPVLGTNPAASPGANPPKGLVKQPVAENRRTPSDAKPTDPKVIDPKSDNTKSGSSVPRAADPARAEPNNPLASVAREVAAPGSDPGANPAERAPAQASATGEGSIVPAASLRRIRTVEPVYPVAARRRKEQGMVEVLFTVTPDGSVENVEVRKSMPELVFDEAAKKAVEQWRFEPVKVNGQAISQRASARLRFSMD